MSPKKLGAGLRVLHDGAAGTLVALTDADHALIVLDADANHAAADPYGDAGELRQVPAVFVELGALRLPLDLAAERAEIEPALNALEALAAQMRVGADEAEAAARAASASGRAVELARDLARTATALVPLVSQFPGAAPLAAAVGAAAATLEGLLTPRKGD